MRLSFAALPAWIALVTVLRASVPGTWWRPLDLPFEILCHRRPERVPSLAGVPLPLCSRCLGLWVGLSIGACLGWPDIPIPRLRWVLLVAVALMLAEILSQDLHLHPIFHPTRLLSGLLVAMPIGGAIGGLARRELGATSA